MKKIDGVLTRVEESDIELLKTDPKKFWEGVTAIGNNAFRNCLSLTELHIPDGITTIGHFSFFGCYNLTKLEISDSVQTIGMYAFFDCFNLTGEVGIPSGVTQIDPRAFCGCKSLNSIKINGVSLKNPKMITKFDAVLSNPQAYQKYLENNIPPEIVDELKEGNKLGLLQNLKFYSKNICEKYIGTSVDACELVTLCFNFSIFSNEKMKLGNNGPKREVEDKVANQGYNILQKLLKQIKSTEIHMHFKAMRLDLPNEAFIRYLSNKANLDEVVQEELRTPGFITQTIAWFNSRRALDISRGGGENIPANEEERYKISVYQTTPLGVDKLKWHQPNVEDLKREFEDKKFVGINARNEKLAEELAKWDLYTQKHFDKAQEIDNERVASGVSDHITNVPVAQSIDDAWKEYLEKTEGKRNEIMGSLIDSVKQQGEVADKVFTYEMLAKSSPANFCMGFYTSCCAKLYGTGSGAQRAMIISPNMQPLVIRDSNSEIVAFGIVYVNRKEGYAVVDDFEVNKRYKERSDVGEAIYKKAMQGVDAFVKQYNLEQEQAFNGGDKTAKKIRKVTCGISPSLTALNDFIRDNPQSEILSAPNLGEFGYAGEFKKWAGDWHKEQYTIWEEESEGRSE